MGVRWHARRRGTAVLWVLVLTGAGVAQGSEELVALQRWNDKLSATRGALPVEEGQKALADIEQWGLKADKLERTERGQLLRLEIYAALAVGDAGRAASVLPELELDFPDSRETLRAAWDVAIATGDAQRAKRTLEALRKQDAAGVKVLRARLRRLQMMGRPAPDTDVQTSIGRTVALRKRYGTVLVLDFWNTRHKPDDDETAALLSLQQAAARERNVEFLGINSDPPTSLEEAREFVTDAGYRWFQHYEERAKGAPLTDEAFHVASMPWHVIIDGEGNIRAVGVADEREFVYALRAAIAEAQGRYAVLRPKTTDGETASPAEPEPLPVASGRKPDGDKPPAKDDLPHNLEAKRLLDRARTYLKTGMKKKARELLEQIVREYPGTWEAREAQRRLSYL